MRFANAIGVIKLITLILYVSYLTAHIKSNLYSIAITGLVVLGGHTAVKDPKLNFRNAFEGSASASAYGATNAFMKVMFSYAGYENAFNVVNEVKVCLHYLIDTEKADLIEPHQNIAMECPVISPTHSHSIHPSHDRILCRSFERGDPQL